MGGSRGFESYYAAFLIVTPNRNNEMFNIIEDLHKQQYKPVFHDSCNHLQGSYVGSITDLEGKWYDIYVYKSTVNKKSQDVCIRYGKEDHEYISPGSLLNVLDTKSEIYELAAHVILKHGTVEFIRDPNEEVLW
jgi:hypothetical protein